MIRKAFVMRLLPGSESEYARRHNPIWPELREVLKQNGVSQYSIFIDRQTGQLFAYAMVESEECWERIAATDVCRRWWAHMQELMFTNPDASPVVEPLEEVFYLE